MIIDRLIIPQRHGLILCNFGFPFNSFQQRAEVKCNKKAGNKIKMFKLMTISISYQCLGWLAGWSVGRLDRTAFSPVPKRTLLHEIYTTMEGVCCTTAVIKSHDDALQSELSERQIKHYVDIKQKQAMHTHKLIRIYEW